MRWNPALQGLRGLAVTMVLLYHVHRGILTGTFGVDWFTAGPVFDVVELGCLGVDLFFLLSGYLIVGSLARHGDVGRFLLGRARRIYPAFLVPHLLVFAVGPLVGYAWMQGLTPVAYVGHFLSNLLFLPGVFPLPIAQIVAWSLSYEFTFYLMAAAAFAIRGRGRNVAVTAICWALWSAAAAHLLVNHPRAWFLVAGVVVHRCERIGLSTHFDGTRLLGTVSLLVMASTFTSFLPISVLAGGLFLLSLVGERDLLGALLRHRSLQYLGAVSYSMYLWHSMVLFVTKRLFVVGRLIADPYWNLAAYAVASVVASLVTAHASYVFVEQWFTRRFLVPQRRPETIPMPAVLPLAESKRTAA